MVSLARLAPSVAVGVGRRRGLVAGASLRLRQRTAMAGRRLSICIRDELGRCPGPPLAGQPRLAYGALVSRFPRPAAVLVAATMFVPGIVHPAGPAGRALTGIPAFTVEVSVDDPAAGPGRTSSCRLDAAALEHVGAEALRAARLDALSTAELITRTRDALGRLRWPPQDSHAEARIERDRATRALRSRATLYVRLAAEATDGGDRCAAAVAAQVLDPSHNRVGVGRGGERARVTPVAWEYPMTTFAASRADLPDAAAERLRAVAASLAAAWLDAHAW